jgi:lysophospholipase L1-like esterase
MESNPKTILCFGDSNTWGYIPGTPGPLARRYAHNVRWTGVMAGLLGDQYRVVEQGLNGRTTVWDDPCSPDRNGSKHLPMLLDTHAPIDLIIIMLGTNDTKHYLGLNANDIALGASRLIQLVQQSTAGPIETDAEANTPAILLVSPAHIVTAKNTFGHKFDKAIEVSQGLAAAYKGIADELGCYFFDAATVATCPSIDGVHIDETGHANLGKALVEQVKTCLE